MKKKIVFMLQNGIGFGHFKLALTISKYLCDNCEISFITQAKSTRIFDNYNYKIYNFPMLYTLKSNNEILIMNKILNKLINEINPDVVIEDTYPEDFYLNLPSLINVPKILLLNRLTSSEFENFYYNGIINQYNKLIILKDKECFINDITSKEVKNYVNYSSNIHYLSGAFNEPSIDIENEIKEKYNIKNFDKNIVVSCGAGGWHIGTNICEEIFIEAVKTTNKLIKEGINVQTILILGPYSDYLNYKLQDYIEFKDNIKIVDFETDLDALFHVVDLCILRPGYNSTMEAISGNANILLLPGISYMEDQKDWCEELKRDYGVDYLNVDDLQMLYSKVDILLKKKIRTNLKAVNNTKVIAEEIFKVANQKVNNKSINIAINNLENSNKLVQKYAQKLNIPLLIKEKDIITINNIPVLNKSNINHKDYNKYDTLIIYNDKELELNRLSYYDTRYHISSNGTIILEYEEIVANSKETFLKEITNVISNPQKYNSNIIIKIPPKNEIEIENEILKPLEEFIKENNIIITDTKEALTSIVENRLSNFKYGYYRPEITKLT